MIDLDLAGDKNKENGTCAWEKCNNLLDEEMLCGFGPLVIGYLCTSCGEKFKEKCRKEEQEIIDQYDRETLAILLEWEKLDKGR